MALKILHLDEKKQTQREEKEDDSVMLVMLLSFIKQTQVILQKLTCKM